MSRTFGRWKEIGIVSAQQALDLVAEYYPSNVLEPKVRFGLEEIFGTTEAQDPTDPGQSK